MAATVRMAWRRRDGRWRMAERRPRQWCSGRDHSGGSRSAGVLTEVGVEVVLGELPAQLAAEERVGRVAGGGEEEPLLVAPDHGEEGIRRVGGEVEVVVVDDDVHPPVERGEPPVELPDRKSTRLNS